MSLNSQIGKTLRLLSFAVLLVAAGIPLSARAESADAAELMRDFYQALLHTMQHGPALGGKGRFSRLEPVIGSTFDIEFMAQASVGPGWQRLTADQQARLTAAFKRYVVAQYADNFSDYIGEAVVIAGTRPTKLGCIVESRLVMKDGTALEINYLVTQDGAAWRVRDVFMAGMVSELAVRRSQFISILRREGIDGHRRSRREGLEADQHSRPVNQPGIASTPQAAFSYSHDSS